MTWKGETKTFLQEVFNEEDIKAADTKYSKYSTMYSIRTLN